MHIRILVLFLLIFFARIIISVSSKFFLNLSLIILLWTVLDFVTTSRISLLAQSSSCLHPRKKYVSDRLHGGDRVVVYPCGHCWNCIQSFRQSWKIRLFETMIAQRATPLGGFIYDTLTVSPKSLPLLDYVSADTGEVFVLPPDFDFVSAGRCYEIVDHYGGRVPFLAKETVSAWLKSGKARYNYFYRNEIESGKRSKCKIRFFGALEYGPKWSRPHVHICVFGVNRVDWSRFWAKYWRKDMGFTKTKWIDLKKYHQDALADCSRISDYISKYLLKGSEEVDTVKYGLVPPAWRIVSNGIGEEFLSDSRFDWLTANLGYMLAAQVPTETNHDLPSFKVANNACISLKTLSESQVNSLKLYVQNGYKFALPRYYRYRLLGGHRKSIAFDTVQNSLLENACECNLEEVLKFASESPFSPWQGYKQVTPQILTSNLRTFNMVLYLYSCEKDNKNKRRSNWNHLKTLNTKRRLFSHPNRGAIGLLL